jgi:hypothetical protein
LAVETSFSTASQFELPNRTDVTMVDGAEVAILLLSLFSIYVVLGALLLLSGRLWGAKWCLLDLDGFHEFMSRKIPTPRTPRFRLRLSENERNALALARSMVNRRTRRLQTAPVNISR